MSFEQSVSFELSVSLNWSSCVTRFKITLGWRMLSILAYIKIPSIDLSFLISHNHFCVWRRYFGVNFYGTRYKDTPQSTWLTQYEDVSISLFVIVMMFIGYIGLYICSVYKAFRKIEKNIYYNLCGKSYNHYVIYIIIYDIK